MRKRNHWYETRNINIKVQNANYKCINENLNIHPIPGSSAVTSAVSASGFSDQYLFYGFLTKKENELTNVLKNLGFDIL